MRKKAPIAEPIRCYGLSLTRRSRVYWSSILFALIVVLPGARSFAAAAPPVKTVLVLYSFSARNALNDLESLKQTTRARIGARVDFHVEYLEPAHFAEPGYEQSVSDSLASLYRKQKIDLVVVVFFPALQFAMAHRDQIFPGVPILFVDVDPKRLATRRSWPNVTGITTRGDAGGTVALGLQLRPDTTTVAVISGHSPLEEYWAARFDDDLRLNHSSLKAIDLVALPAEELLRRVAELPPHSIVIFFLIPQDTEHPVLGTYDLLAAISQRFPGEHV